MTRYKFVEWRDETDTVVGTTPSLTMFIDKDKTLTAYYEEIPVPEYTLTITAMVGGTTDPTPDSYIYPENTTVKVTAIPDEGYNFDHWILDGIEYTANPISIIMNSDHLITAYFSEEAPPPPPTYKLIIIATSGGTTEPTPGVYEYDAGTIITITATSDEGYKFKRFELDGEIKMQNPINVGMDADHTLLAVFEVEAPPIPPLAIVLGLSAVGTGTVYIVTREKKEEKK